MGEREGLVVLSLEIERRHPGDLLAPSLRQPVSVGSVAQLGQLNIVVAPRSVPVLRRHVQRVGTREPGNEFSVLFTVYPLLVVIVSPRLAVRPQHTQHDVTA